MYPNLRHHLITNLDLPAESLEFCAVQFSAKTVKKNEVLLRPGEILNSTLFVEKGLLRMYSIDKAGKEHLIQFAPENWLMSDRSSLYFNEPSDYFIDAVEDGEVLYLQPEFFVTLQRQYPEIVKKNDLLLQNHIRNLQRRINQLLGASAEERYVDFIQMYPDVVQRVPQWMVASYLGITPESLSRVRKELVKRK